MEDIEDDDLSALRQAALASIGRNRSVRNTGTSPIDKREDDNEAIFDKLKPPKSSNLINLTPDPNANCPLSGETIRNRQSSSDSGKKSDASESNTSDSEQSSSDSESSSESESEKEPEKEKLEETDGKDKVNNEEDDLLSAIDQFLVGDTPASVVSEDKSSTEETKQEKKEEKIEKKKKVKKMKKIKKKRKEKIGKIKEENISSEPLKVSETIVPDTTNNKEKVYNKPWRKSPTSEANDNDNDSVHSSDLSFLTDSENEGQGNGFTRNNGERKDKSYSPEKKPVRLARPRSLSPQYNKRERPGKKFADLREKLKNRRGLRRNYNTDPVEGSREYSGNIYVKASLLDETNTNIASKQPSLGVQLNKDQPGRIIVTRNVGTVGNSPSSVHLKRVGEDKGDLNGQIKRGSIPGRRSIRKTSQSRTRNKRSVVQFAPETSFNEKRQKIASLILEDVEETAFSDMSDQDFNDFEIEEEQLNEEEDEIEEPEITFETDEKRPVERRFITTIRNDNFDTQKSKKNVDKDADKQRLPVRERLGAPVDHNRPKVSPSLPKHARRIGDFGDPDELMGSRNLKRKRDPVDGWDSGTESAEKMTVVSRRGRYKGIDEVNSDPVVHKRRRGVAVKLPVSKKSPKSRKMKTRLGLPLHRERSPPRGKTSRKEQRRDEEAVDARIRRINKQNEEILKRRQLVEMEEKRFRLQST